MIDYFRSIWSTRFFWMSLVKHDLNTRYRRSLLGVGWSLLHPIGMTLVLCIVFHEVFGLEMDEYGPFLLAGISFWIYVTTVVQGGCQTFFQSEIYMRQYPAPAAIYPLRTVLGASFHLALAIVVVILSTWILTGFGNLSALPFLIPTFALLMIFGWSVATLAGLANTHFPDAQHLTDLALQVLFYVTPIIYPPEMLQQKGMGWLVTYNPLASVLELVRQPILEGVVPPLATIGTATLLISLTAGTAGLALMKLQRHLVYHL